MKTSAETRMGRLKFKANFRRELIDTSERQIEHHKSMIKNYKAQLKELNREMATEHAKAGRYSALHQHQFARSKPTATVETCPCGKFRFTEYAGPSIQGQD